MEPPKEMDGEPSEERPASDLRDPETKDRESSESVIAHAHGHVLSAAIDRLLSPGRETQLQMHDAILGVPEKDRKVYVTAQAELDKQLLADHEQLEAHAGNKIGYLFASYIKDSADFSHIAPDERAKMIQTAAVLQDSYHMTDEKVIEPSPGIIIIDAGNAFFTEMQGAGIISQDRYMVHVSGDIDPNTVVDRIGAHMSKSRGGDFPDFIVVRQSIKDKQLNEIPELRHEVGHTIWSKLAEKFFIPRTNEKGALAPYFNAYRNEATQYLLTAGYAKMLSLTTNNLHIPLPDDGSESHKRAQSVINEFVSLYDKARQKGIEPEALTYFTMTSRNFDELKERMGRFIDSESVQSDGEHTSAVERLIKDPGVRRIVVERLLGRIPGLRRLLYGSDQGGTDGESALTITAVIEKNTVEIYDTLIAIARLQAGKVPMQRLEAAVAAAQDIPSVRKNLESITLDPEPLPSSVVSSLLLEKESRAISTIDDFHNLTLFYQLVLAHAKAHASPLGESLPHLQEQLVRNAQMLLEISHWNPEVSQAILSDLSYCQTEDPDASAAYRNAAEIIRSGMLSTVMQQINNPENENH
jgi:hypothetical protein